MDLKDIEERIIEYIIYGQKLKICILYSALKKIHFSYSDLLEDVNRYYPFELFDLSETYNSLKRDGLIVSTTSPFKDKLVNKEYIQESFKKYRAFIEHLLNKNYLGSDDILGTMDERYSYLIKRLFMRGGVVSKDILMSDIQRDIFYKKAPLRYSNISEPSRLINTIQDDLEELRKKGYIDYVPAGYHLRDFIFHNILSDTKQARELFSSLSLDLWTSFNFESYLRNLEKIREKSKLCSAVDKAIESLKQNRLNDALDNVNMACEELVNVICTRIFGDVKKVSKSLTGRIVEIWKQQDLCREDPSLSEHGKRAATFLASAIFVPKWIRDKTSHPLITPTPDSVRLALASLLLAIDIAIRLRLLD